MRIEPSAVHGELIQGPGAWRGADVASPENWTVPIPEPVLAEIDAALERIRMQGKTLSDVCAEDFPLPSFTGMAAGLRRELGAGRGFVLMRGLPRHRYSDQQLMLAYWGIGAYLGVTLPQNVKGDRVYSVRDEGYKIEKDYGAVGVRFSKTADGVHFHTDSAPALMGNTPDVVGLLALHVAASGGDSVLVSAHTLHNILLQERPDVLARLYQPYHIDRAVELIPGESRTLFAPVFRNHPPLAIRYFRYYIPKGHEAAGEPMSEFDIEALDVLEQITNRAEVQVHFSMQPGDIQFASNTFVLHSRTAFEDHPDPERRRHLIRLWLNLHVY